MILTVFILLLVLTSFSAYKFFHECEDDWIPGVFIGGFLSIIFFALSITVPVKTMDFPVSYTCESTTHKVFAYTPLGEFESSDMGDSQNWAKKYPGFVKISYDSFGGETMKREFYVKIP